MAEASIPTPLSNLLTAPDSDESAEEKVNLWLKNAKGIVALVNEEPAVAIATISISSTLPFQLSHLISIAIFGKLNHFNDHYLQHIIAAVYATNYLANTKAQTSCKKAITQFLRSKGLLLWLDIVRLQRVLFTTKSSHALSHIKLNSAQRLCVLASVVSSCKQEHRSAVFLRCIRLIPTHQRNLVKPLIELFERPLPGAKVYANGMPATVIDIKQGHSFVYITTAKNTKEKRGAQVKNSSSKISEHQNAWIKNASIRAPIDQHIELDEFIAVYYKTAADRVATGGQGFFPSTYGIQKPPTPLLHIIDELQKRDIDIPSLCEKIERVPSFNNFLVYTASQDNRLKLPVKSIKQAVLTYGTERVGDMLIQFALMERLTQHKYPLVETCKHFTLLASAFASKLSSLTKTKFSPQSAALTMTFVCSPLFTQPELKVMTRLQIRETAKFSINTTFKIASSSTWLSIAGELSGNWHQSSTWRALLHHCNKTNDKVPKSLRKEHAIILSAFYLAKTCLFNDYNALNGVDKEIAPWLSVLSLSPSDLSRIIDEHREQFYCPLPH